MTYAIGIDLGTTHSALAAVDLDLTEGDEIALSVLEVPQSTSPGQVESKPLLPSFLYLPHRAGGELAAGSLTLPWDAAPAFAVGELARVLGQKTPLRLVSSAKSWLGHAGVDRRAAILPAQSDDTDVERISPLAAQVAYLSHLRAAWNAKNEDAPMQEQDVVLTVPASFDPAARELTAEAARQAGLGHAVLLEEPQAALYAWIERSHGTWRDDVKVGDVILIVDLGGGTTDFSLIAVSEAEGRLELRRVAVGDHILLGGDNMDLTLAAVVKQRLEAEGKLLDAFQSAVLVHACRAAKETLLGDDAPDSVPVVVPARGSKLVAGSIRTELSRQDALRLVLEGFFPSVEIDARPTTRPRAALTALGLPYAQDAAITRHLASFLSRHVGAMADLSGFAAPPAGARFARPTTVLFNGGVLKSRVLAERIEHVLASWLASEGAPPARVLAGSDLDLAVARGAAYYAYVRRGKGVRIRGGTAKSYYVGVESAMPAVPGMEPPLSALCVAPFGMEEGTEAPPAKQELGLVVGEPVRFRFFESATRRDDLPGTMLDRIGDDLAELPAIEATMPTEGRAVGDVVPVRLGAAVTEVGTLRLEAFPRSGTERWKVELEVRARPGL